MVNTKNITLSNNEEIFKLKNEIAQIDTLNDAVNQIVFDLGDNLNILKYIYGESPQIKGEEATQIITTTPTTVTSTTVVTRVRNTISYQSNFAVLPFNCILKESVGGTSAFNDVTDIDINAPTNMDSTLIMYFYPFQYAFLKNTIVTIHLNNRATQIPLIDLRKDQVDLRLVNFPLNSSTTDNLFDYGFAKLVFKIKKLNSFFNQDWKKYRAICFVSDLVKNV